MGVRWRCERCRDFDFCFKCYWTAGETHDSTHTFRRMPESNGDPDKEPQFEELDQDDDYSDRQSDQSFDSDEEE